MACPATPPDADPPANQPSRRSRPTRPAGGGPEMTRRDAGEQVTEGAVTRLSARAPNRGVPRGPQERTSERIPIPDSHHPILTPE